MITDNSGQNRITSKDESCCATNTLLPLPVRRSRSKRKRKEKYAIGPCVNINFIWASVKNWRTTYCITLPFITSPSLLVRKSSIPLSPTVQDNWIQDRVTLEGPMEEFRDQLAPLSSSRMSTLHCIVYIHSQSRSVGGDAVMQLYHPRKWVNENGVCLILDRFS